MSGARELGIVAIAAFVGLALPCVARAQEGASAAAPDAPPAEEGGADDAGEAEEAARSTALPAGPAPDELPEGADSGPPMLSRPRPLTPEEERRARERRYDASEPLMPAAFQLFVGFGAALDSSLDGALAAHRFGSSPLVVSADATFLGRVTEWLQLGGRIGGRARGWGSDVGDPAVAGGIGALAIAHARAYLGRIVDLGAVLGVGIGWAGISIQGAGSTGVAPLLHGAVVLGFRIDRGFRLAARFAWDWFTLYDLDRYGSDLDLGGPSLAIGFEVRR